MKDLGSALTGKRLSTQTRRRRKNRTGEENWKRLAITALGQKGMGTAPGEILRSRGVKKGLEAFHRSLEKRKRGGGKQKGKKKKSHYLPSGNGSRGRSDGMSRVLTWEPLFTRRLRKGIGRMEKKGGRLREKYSSRSSPPLV